MRVYPFDKPMKSLYFGSFVVSVLFARFHFKAIRKSFYHSFYRCRHHHRGHHSAESGSDRDSSYSREERRHHRSAAVICENEPYCFSNQSIGHFQVPPGLCIKTRVSAQPLIWKWFFILMQIKLIFTRKVVHLASLWKWGFLELGTDGGIKTKDNSNKFNFMVKNTDRRDYKSWLHFAGFFLPGFVKTRLANIL